MPPPTLSLDSLGFLSATSLERSYSSSSLRASPSPSKASPARVPQKSFGRLPARVAAAPVRLVVPVVTRTDTSSTLTLSLDGVREEITRDLPPIEDEVADEHDKAELRADIEVLREALQDLRDASSKVVARTQNDEAWQRENARLKEQLAAANTREAAQQEQLRIRDDQLALCRQELRELQERQLTTEAEHAARPSLDDAGGSGLGHERELLKLVVQLVGASNVRAVLRENATASPAQLREALVRLRCSQCRRPSPTSRASSPAKSMGSGQPDSLHKLLFGSSSPPSPTANRFNSTGPRSPLK